MIESAIDHEKLAALIRDAKEGRENSPSEFTNLLMYDLRDLEGSANVPIHTAELQPNSRQLQVFMRRCLAVIDALLAMSFAPSHALFWFRCFPLRDFNHKAPVMVLSEENVERVVESLRNVFDVDRPGLGDFYECMRRDTLSILARTPALRSFRGLASPRGPRNSRYRSQS
jgi:hypothetical protein